MRVALAFAACVFIWGTTWYAIEWQLGYVAKGWALTYRYAISAALMFLWCIYKGKSLRLPQNGHRYALGLGLFLFSGNYALVYWGTEYLTSGLVAVTFSLLTFFNILNARIFLGAKFQSRMMIAALLGVCGIALIFKPEIQTFTLADTTTAGLILCIVSTVIASLGNTIAGTPVSSKLPILPFNAWGMLYGTGFNILFAVLAGEKPSLDPRPEFYIALAYLSVFGTVIAFSLFLWLLGQIGVARAGYMAVMTPLVALLVSTLFEGYEWTGYAVTGVLLVLSGNLLIIEARKSAVPPQAPPIGNAKQDAYS